MTLDELDEQIQIVKKQKSGDMEVMLKVMEGGGSFLVDIDQLVLNEVDDSTGEEIVLIESF